MRKLTIAPRAGKRYFNLLEEFIGCYLSNSFKEIMIGYAGLMILEDNYRDKNGTIWELQSFDNIVSVLQLTKEFKENGWGLKIPFAYDPGGWHFCLSFDKESYGKIIINRWTDHSPEEQFLVIAENFDEFINSLQISPEENSIEGKVQSENFININWLEFTQILDSLQIVSGQNYGRKKIKELITQINNTVEIHIEKEGNKIRINNLNELQQLISSYDKFINIEEFL